MNIPQHDHALDGKLDNMLEGTDYIGEVSRAVKATDIAAERAKVFKKLSEYAPEKRWREAVKWLFTTNKEARLEHQGVMASVKELKEDSKNKFASDKAMTIRHGLRMPSTVMATIEIVDPNVTVQLASKNAQDQKAMMHKLMRAFPEYCVPKLV